MKHAEIISRELIFLIFFFLSREGAHRYKRAHLKASSETIQGTSGLPSASPAAEDLDISAFSRSFESFCPANTSIPSVVTVV
jgi:hypothetical protein